MDRLTRAPVDPEALRRRLETPGCGALASFVGIVRSPNRGRQVRRIEYSAYEPMAEQILNEIESDLTGRFPGVRMAILHRLGDLGVGEISVAVAAAAPHRREALEACAAAIEAIKARAPIWKKEHYADGSSWIEADRCRPA